MGKTLSVRIDEDTAQEIGVLAGAMHTTKKAVIEQAIALYAKAVASKKKSDPLDRSFGAWVRKESAQQTVENARTAFRNSMERRKR